MDGFRAMVRTIVDEVLGFRPDFIAHQLAHPGHRPQRTGPQPEGVPAGMKENDAGMGRLFGSSQGW